MTITASQMNSLRRAIERRFGAGANGYSYSRTNSVFTITDDESGSWVRGSFSAMTCKTQRLTVHASHDGSALAMVAQPVQQAQANAAMLSAPDHAVRVTVYNSATGALFAQTGRDPVEAYENVLKIARELSSHARAAFNAAWCNCSESERISATRQHITVTIYRMPAMVEQPCQQQQAKASPAMSDREAAATRASIARLRTKAGIASNPIDAARLNASADRLSADLTAAKVPLVEPSDPRAPLADELALLGRLIGTDDPQVKAQMRGIVERARRETAAMVRALRLAEGTIGATLIARGYQQGTCTDEWSFEVRSEVAALPVIRAAISATAGMVPHQVQQQQACAAPVSTDPMRHAAVAYESSRDRDPGELTYSTPAVMAECIDRAFGLGWHFDHDAYCSGDWPWFLRMGFQEGRCVRRSGEWRLYVETAAEALAEAGEADSVALVEIGRDFI